MASDKLGDLSKFNVIVGDVKKLVDSGDLVSAKTRIKDLEIAWDSAEAGLKPRSPENWHIIDNSIDTTLTALRATNPVKNDCQQAIDSLLTLIDGKK